MWDRKTAPRKWQREWVSASSVRAHWDAQSILGKGGMTVHQSVTLLPWDVGKSDRKRKFRGRSTFNL